MNIFITWPAQARALSKYNLVILNAGGEIRRITASETGGIVLSLFQFTLNLGIIKITRIVK